MKLIPNEDMEVRLVPATPDTATNREVCRICGLAQSGDEWKVQVGLRAGRETGEDAGVFEGAALPNLDFRMCMTCAVTALRRVYEYCSLYREQGRDAAAEMCPSRFCGPHPALR